MVVVMVNCETKMIFPQLTAASAANFLDESAEFPFQIMSFRGNFKELAVGGS
jgi:hypothetical protein